MGQTQSNKNGMRRTERQRKREEKKMPNEKRHSKFIVVVLPFSRRRGITSK